VGAPLFSKDQDGDGGNAREQRLQDVGHSHEVSEQGFRSLRPSAARWLCALREEDSNRQAQAHY
jgi:hypothetical protein